MIVENEPELRFPGWEWTCSSWPVTQGRHVRAPASRHLVGFREKECTRSISWLYVTNSD